MPVAAVQGGLNDFQIALQGSWTNLAFPSAPNGEGSTDNPLSYNVMPLPQDSSSSGYILKNFTLWETVKFNDDSSDVVAIPTTAANRGGNIAQAPTALYYEQQVFFAEGPSKDGVVHTENGSWLNLRTNDPMEGPYAPVTFQNPNQQPPTVTIAKQMSIPHGNSILALGQFEASVTGVPTIPPFGPITPTPPGLDTTQYTTASTGTGDYQNPQPDLTADPHKPLRDALALIPVTSYIHWNVTTKQITGGKGSTMNIPFESRDANVADYSADYWLLSTDGTNYKYLAYSQNIELEIPITVGGTTKTYTFPHVTTNVVTKIPTT